MKWRSALGIICDKKVLLKLKGEFHRKTVGLAMFYEIEYWEVKCHHGSKISAP